MKKSELKSRMVVETRSGDRYMAIRDGDELHFMNRNGRTFVYDIFNDDLIDPHNTGFDIMKIYDRALTFKDVKYTTNLLWERKPPMKMTIGQIEEIFGRPVEIVEEVQS